jgi:hypothetical protein
MQAHGLVRQPRPQPRGKPGEARAAERRQPREVRSFEAEYVGSLLAYLNRNRSFYFDDAALLGRDV